MTQPIYQVDAFTSQPFSGNPAAVCVLPAPAAERWMQAVAGEMNLSETAFLHPIDGGYHLRWFTPATEVDLCGHATLASAHILWETGALPPDAEARFQSRSGLLTARRLDDLIELNFPRTPAAPAEAPDDLLAALGLPDNAAAYVGKNQFDYLIEVTTADAVRRLRPDFAALSAIPMRGVMVTALGDDEQYDFVSRFFAPGVGIDEDPVTGSAHCCLGPHWADRLGKTTLRAHQSSTRGGEMLVIIDGDRVRLAGRAVTVLRGELYVD